MKLSDKHIAKIEAIMSAYEERGRQGAKKLFNDKNINVNMSHVVNFLKDVGVDVRAAPRGRGFPSKIDVALANEMRAAGISIKEIANHFGVSQATLCGKIGRRPKDARKTAAQFLAERVASAAAE